MLSSILRDKSDSEQNDKRRSDSSYNCYTIMAFPTVLCSAVLHVNPDSTLPVTKNLLLDPLKNRHPLFERKTLKLVSWKVFGKTFYGKEFQAKQSNLCQNVGEEE